MTETTRFVSKRTAVGLLALVTAMVVFLAWLASERYRYEEQRGCMIGVEAPVESDPQYDLKMLEFTSDVRKCMRG